MPKTIYDKPVRALMHDMVQERGLQPGQVISFDDVLDWFRTNYPKVQTTSVRLNLTRLSTNNKNRLYFSAKPEDDLFFKIASNRFRLYEPDKDPSPIHEGIATNAAADDSDLALDEEEAEVLPVATSEFLLERDLQYYLAKNLQVVEPGLSLYEGESGTGLEFAVGGRFIDILAVDSTGALVVLELKVSKGYDRVIGQLLRYINWIRQNVAEPGQKVRGMIVCRRVSEDLRLACASIANVELFEYQLSVAVSKVESLSLDSSALNGQ